MVAVVCLAGACAPAPVEPVADTTARGGAREEAEVRGTTTPGALVLLVPAGEALGLPPGPAVLDQFSKAFVPDLLIVRVGQAVIFKNSEDQLHNVTVTRSGTGTTVFNISQNQGDTHTHVFDEAGEFDVTCDVHPGMRATLVASPTPYVMYADASGAFRFAGVPHGRYLVRVRARGRVVEREVDAGEGRTDVGMVDRARQ